MSLTLSSSLCLSFSQRLLTWFDQHGRKHLPWQHPADPYRIWISEIMLQQTQVATVIPYFERFMISFPDIDSLATASIESVLSHWSGLGYYARARNLHKAAQHIRLHHHGKIPTDPNELIALPGIGKSTAHAILSLAYQQPKAICDGNVKRVLARWLTLETEMNKPIGEKQAWIIAEQLQNHQRPHHYTQAIMDLGATLCTRSNPNCIQCPLNQDCKAYLSGQNVTNWPHKRQPKTKPNKHCEMWLIFRPDGSLWLQAPEKQEGLWGGLYQPPQRPPCNIDNYHYKLPEITHNFTHFRLHISTYIHLLNNNLSNQDQNGLWYNPKNKLHPPMPAIVDKLIQHWQAFKEITDGS